MQANDLLATVSRVKRAMPRNADVMAICEALERRLIEAPPPAEKPKFDRRAYQRELMRKRRAGGKA